jgi:DNA-binding MarR family transcriptional regulator
VDKERQWEGLSTETRSLRASGLTDEIGFLIARARVVTLELVDEQLEEFGLKRQSYATLSLACTEYGLTQRELAASLKVDPSRLVAILDELQGRNLVVREVDPADRRSRTIRATETGQKLCAQAADSVRRVEELLLGEIPAEERATVMGALRRIAFPTSRPSPAGSSGAEDRAGATVGSGHD